MFVMLSSSLSYHVVTAAICFSVLQSTLFYSVECLSSKRRFQHSKELKPNLYGEEETRHPCPNNHDYCEHVDNYPTEEINNLMAEHLSLYGDLFADQDVIQPLSDIRTKKSNDVEVVLCPYKTKHIYPRMARNAQYDWEYVINTDRYKQPVTMEICLNVNKDGGCRIPGTLSNGYTSSCEQKHGPRVMLVAKRNASGRISQVLGKPIHFPLHCCCKVTEPSGHGTEVLQY